MKPEKYLENYLISKIGKKKFKTIEKINLIQSGVLDSLDIATLSAEIRKKFKIHLNFNDEKSIKVFESYKRLLSRIKR